MHPAYHSRPPFWARYGAALLFTVLALSLTMMVPTLRDRAMFMLFVTAVSMSAWYGGLGPALVSIVIASCASAFFLLPSLFSFDVPNGESLLGLITFLFVAIFISTLHAWGQRAHEQTTTILESITDGFIVFDTNWRYVYLNRNAEVLTRRSWKELIGTNLWEQFPETVNSTLYTECHRAMAENTPRYFEYFHSEFEQWFEFRAYPSKRGLALYVSDITVRKRADMVILKYNEELEQHVKDRTLELEAANAALTRQADERTQTEEALHQSEEQFRSLTESANDAIVSADSSGRILSWNRSAETIFGYADKEAIGKPLTLLLPDRYWETYQKGLQGVQGGESRIVGKMLELSGLKKDGTEFAIELSLAAWHTGESRFFSGIIRDITARKQAEELLTRHAQELARSNSELQQFAYVASHDLQEPLRMVASYTQLLAAHCEGKVGPEASYFMKYIVEGAMRMATLIHDILAYSLFDPKKKDYRMADCELVLTSALRNLENTIQESGANITHDQLPTIEAVPTQLTQVFQNLIGNAIKFRNSEAPQIHISAERPLQEPNNTNEWLFSVRDNGIGLPQEYGEQIFDVFKRLHLRHEYPGTGIGLAICKKVIEGHGGRIWVKSQPGHGATFWFTIPSKGGNNGHA